MKITLYTITECEFSKQEKEYLASHQLAFEEKNLETNKEFLTEMLAVSNNFAGTPVTKVEKDDGKIEVLKGFTKEEFDKTLGFAAKPDEKPPVQEKQAQTPAPAQSQPFDSAQGKPTQPAPQQPSQPPTQPQASPPAPQQPANQPSSNPPPTNDPLNSILADLQAKSVAQTAGGQSTTSNQEQATNSPANSVPSVPDFPAKT